jgi:hypothetical protein
MSDSTRIKKLISNTLHSLEIINTLNKLECLDDKQQEILNLNIKHIEIMLSIPEFKKACTKTQLKKFNDIIKN